MVRTPRDSASPSIQIEVEIAASPESVWRAITDPGELVRWFAPEAVIRPGAGGRIWLSWGGGVEAEWRIACWEPGRYLRTAEVAALGGRTVADGDETPSLAGIRERSVEYAIEPRGRSAVLRLHHSGFPPSWEGSESLDGIRRGWAFELLSLRHYLERHHGTPRVVAQVRRVVSLPPRETWMRLMKALGAAKEPRAQQEFSYRSATGDRLTGLIAILDRPHQLVALVANFNDAVLRVKTAAANGGGLETTVWLAAYGVPASRVRAFEGRWVTVLEGLAPAAAAGAPVGVESLCEGKPA